jgi:hypothetical protein
MKTYENKTIQFIYQETQIHFLINPSDENVMVNATEMAKLFDKRIDVFLKANQTKKFIKALEKKLSSLPPNGGNESLKILETNTNLGTYMHRTLALKFAAWLDTDLEIWIYDTIEKILFGNYKKHWDAHVLQLEAEKNKKFYKAELYKNLTIENLNKYFEAENKINAAKKAKRKAIANQLKMEL